MTDHPSILPTPDPQLPRAGMLSYLATAATPTRVRHIASLTLRILALVHLLIAGLFLAALAYDSIPLLWDHYRVTHAPPPAPIIVPGPGGVMVGPMRFGGPPAPTWTELLLAIAERWAPAIVAIFISGTTGIVMWACAAPVSRGRKIPCRFAVLTLVPAAFVLLVAAMGCVTFSIGQGFGLIEPPANPWALLVFLPAALAVLLLLLLKDLAAYLLWIARNPITEKPPIRFLPRSTHSTM